MIRKIKIAYYKYKFDDLSEQLALILCGISFASAREFHAIKLEYQRFFNILKNHDVPLYPLSDAIRSVAYNRNWPSFKPKYSFDEVLRRNEQELRFFKNGSFEIK